MKTLEEAKALVLERRDQHVGAWDGRDVGRFLNFVPHTEWEQFGGSLEEGSEPPTPREWTEENVRKQLADDIQFGWEKAYYGRGLSAPAMVACIELWTIILDKHMVCSEYRDYGKEYIKSVAKEFNVELNTYED